MVDESQKERRNRRIGVLSFMLAIPFLLNVICFIVISVVAFYSWLFGTEIFWLFNVNGTKLAVWLLITMGFGAAAIPWFSYLEDRDKEYE